MIFVTETLEAQNTKNPQKRTLMTASPISWCIWVGMWHDGTAKVNRFS